MDSPQGSRLNSDTSAHQGWRRFFNLGFRDHPLADEIQWERHHLFMREVGPRMAATLVVAVLVGLLFASSASTGALATWFGVNLFVGLNSWFILRRYHTRHVGKRPNVHDPEQQKSVHRWHIANIYLSLIWGIQWALTPVLFFPDASIVQVFGLLLVITITSSMPSMTMGLYPDVYIAFLTPVLGTFSWFLFNFELDGSWLHKIMAPLVWVSLVGFSFGMFRTQLHALVLRLELQQSKREIEQANEAKTRFLAAASHDIRQPLQAASLYWSAIHPEQINASQQPVFERLGSSLRATNELLNHLLDVSRLDAGVARPAIKSLSLAALLDELRMVFAPLASRKRLELAFDCSPQLYIQGDQTMTLQVIKNLIANALQYTERGAIRISAGEQDGEIWLAVTDTGIGIPEDHQEAIFDEFVQLNNPGRQRHKGLGLGLSIVQRLCQLQGFGLKLTSTPGSGSCFTVYMPAGDSTACEPARSAPARQDYSGLKVLVVDDHQEILDSLSVLLVNWDCDVWVADSLAALDRELRSPACLPDVVITDDMLGDDGSAEAVIRTLKLHLGYDPDIILMTGNSHPSRIATLQRLGYPLLQKPIDSKTLQQTLDELPYGQRSTPGSDGKSEQPAE